MKVLALALVGAVFAIPAQADEALAKKHNCLACHTVDKKLVGPSYKEIAKKYKGQNVAAKLEEKVKKGGSGVWGNAAMPPMAAIANKEMVNAAFETTLDQGLIVERRIFQILAASEDKAEGMAAFVEKRAARFTHQ